MHGGPFGAGRMEITAGALEPPPVKKATEGGTDFAVKTVVEDSSVDHRH